MKKKRPAHRPKLPKGMARVVLPAQRVDPATLATYRAAGKKLGGIGRALDLGAKLLRESEK